MVRAERAAGKTGCGRYSRSAAPHSAPQDNALLRRSSWEEEEVMEIELKAMSLVSWYSLSS